MFGKIFGGMGTLPDSDCPPPKKKYFSIEWKLLGDP